MASSSHYSEEDKIGTSHALKLTILHKIIIEKQESDTFKNKAAFSYSPGCF